MSVVAAVTVLAVTGTLMLGDAGAATSNRVEWNGRARFVAGANVPWYNWACDFGCGTSGGVSDPAVRSVLDSRFAQFRATGMDTLRWWMFEPSGGGNIWQIRPGANGRLEVNPAVYADIDAALALAQKHDLYFVFVLFAGVGPENMPSSWVNDAAQREQLASALGDLFGRYGTSNRILAWEIYNEPEWQIWNNLASEANAVALADLIENQVHARTSSLVTMGEATVDGIPMWKTVSLDFHAPHWYSNMSSGSSCAACRDYASVSQQYGTTRPVVIGEWDAPDGSVTRTRWDHWLGTGYAGGLGWSIFPERTGDRIPFGYSTASGFVQANGAALQGSPSPTPTPTKTAVASVTPTKTATVAASPTSTKTATASATASATATKTATAVGSATATATKTATAVGTASATPTKTATATSTASATPTQTATVIASPPATGGAECQRLFRYRDRVNSVYREVWRTVDCATGVVVGPIR